MSRSTKLTIGLIAAAALVLAGFLLIPDRGQDTPAAPEASDTAGPQLVREDSPRLSEGSSEVVFVEYLDFECEACLSLYPTVEELRAEYGDRVTFVVRYLPLHGNSLEAAQAAEAAKDQGEFEAMYKALFDNATEWGIRRRPSGSCSSPMRRRSGWTWNASRRSTTTPPPRSGSSRAPRTPRPSA